MDSPAQGRFQQYEQIQFSLELDNGYSFKTWIRYYRNPNERSHLGRLATTYITTSGQNTSTVDEFLQELMHYTRA